MGEILKHPNMSRLEPDPDCVTRDEAGRPLFRYCCDYRLFGRGFTFTLWAYDFDDAEARLDAIRQSGHIAGQVLSEVTG